MTIYHLYRLFLEKLSTIYSKNEAAAITQILFEHHLTLTKSDIIKNPDDLVADNIAELLHLQLHRLMEHMPIQYVIEKALFFQLNFYVNEHVLIPRPETEELVQEVIDFLKVSPEKKILEIGTGSGCIAISIKKHIPECHLTAMDISEEALKVAQKNATLHSADITFLQLDFLKIKNVSNVEKFDVIISNPPYIPQEEITSLEKNVTLFEPHQALFVPNDRPLLFYEAIHDFSKEHLTPNGKIFLEAHESYAKNVQMIFAQNSWESHLKKDMMGKDRMVMATRYQ